MASFEDGLIRLPFNIRLSPDGSPWIDTYSSTPTIGKEKDFFGTYYAVLELPEEVQEEIKKRQFRAQVVKPKDVKAVAVKETTTPTTATK